jgi:peptidoglycan-associated lipoprotein
MGPKSRRRTILLGVLAIAMVFSGCHKNPPAPATPPTPEAPPPPPAAPKVTLTAEPATVEKGQSVTLNWSSQNATTLDLQPQVGSVQATGSTTVTPDQSTTYVLTAKGPGGTDTASARVTVTAEAPPPPPEKIPQVAGMDVVEGLLKDAYFDLDRSDIRPDAQQTLTADADVLKANPNFKVTIEGHCDERGSEEYNLGLGDRRATAVKSFLINLGLPADRLTTISYGKDRPQCSESTEECWQRNRRAHFQLK